MSISINVYYSGKDGSARKFVEEMENSENADQVRTEPGCMKYEYFFAFSDPETVVLIEYWQDQAALDLHHATPMMGQISKLREIYDLHMKVERFLPDDAGVPDSDRQFIRD